MFGLAVLTPISVVPSDINRLTNRPENISHSAYQENRGQWPANVRYLLQKPGLNYWITDRGVRLDFHRTELVQAESDRAPQISRSVGHVVDVEFLAATGAPEAEHGEALPFVTNYLRGDANKGATGAKSFSEVTLKQVAPGISARYYQDAGAPRYDLILQPKAKVSDLQMQYKGAQNLRVQPDGSLTYETAVGTIREQGLFAFQKIAGKVVEVKSRFVVSPHGVVGFQLGAYDPTQPVVVDPQVTVNSAIVGGSGNESIGELEVVGDTIFAVGSTPSADFPVTTGAYDTIKNGDDAFVAKFKSNLRGASLTLTTLTYLGGDANESEVKLAYITNNVIVACRVSGATTNPLPIVTDPSGDGSAAIATKPGANDVWLGRLNTDLSAIRSSTWASGSNNDELGDICVAPDGKVGLTGNVGTGSNITVKSVNNVNGTRTGNGEGYVMVFSKTLDNLDTSIYYGGSGTGQSGEKGFAICSSNESDGFFVAFRMQNPDVLAGTQTVSTSPLITVTPQGHNKTFQAPTTDNEVVVVRMASDTRSGTTSRNGVITSETVLSTTGADQPSKIRISRGGAVTVLSTVGAPVAVTDPEFVTTANAYDRTRNGGTDIAITRFNASLSSVISSTLFGGSGNESGLDFVQNASGNLYVLGSTNSTDLPVTSESYVAPNSGFAMPFVIRINSATSSLLSSTYLHTSGANSASVSANALGLLGDFNDVIFGGGVTGSLANSTSNTYGPGGGTDAYISRLCFSSDLVTANLSSSSVVGGTKVFAEAVLNCPAGGVGKNIAVVSSNPAVASPAAASFLIPSNASRGSIRVFTSPVLVPTPVTITLSNGGISQVLNLIVNP